ncbi:MAG: hypothetical protein PHV78_03720 [Patescibacteria group bacterium]|nr:hypothetical protein [Patescibacteria group bacterium]MDD5121505.1 hypothetical protein [Patescibacteria group bacterium]MDD5222043.1 hypothetical protein [Patescibacteria group bacterium]MDD5396333.1 hypothetical protein [Patescibacteria group bacterium]
MNQKINKFIYWAPRILSIIFIFFLTLFSLDIISPELSFWQIIIGLFIHNIPVFILLIILITFWKREIISGIVFIMAGILYVILILVNILKDSFQWYMVSWILMVAGPAFFIGVLFIINWVRKKQNRF